MAHGTFRLLAPVLFALCVACGPSPAQEAPSGSGDAELSEFMTIRGYEGIQMERMRTGHFMITAETETIPILLVIDTGAGRTIMDRALAARLDVPLFEQEARASGLGTSETEIAIGELRKVNIGPVAFETMPVTFLDLSHVNTGLQAAGQPAIHGVIGADFLRFYRAVLDYESAMLYVKPR